MRAAGAHDRGTPKDGSIPALPVPSAWHTTITSEAAEHWNVEFGSRLKADDADLRRERFCEYRLNETRKLMLAASHRIRRFQ